MSDISKVQEKPDQVHCETTARPVFEEVRSEIPALTARAADHRRYRVALAISLAVLLGVVAFGLFATLL